MMAKVKYLSKPTIKLIVFPQETKKGYPLKIRIIKDRKASYINLKHYLSKKEMKKFISSKTGNILPSYPQYNEVKKLYDKALVDYNIDEEEAENDNNGLTFSENFNNYLEQLNKRGQFGLLQKTTTVKYHLDNFTNYANLKFSDITIDFLKDFQTYLISLKYEKGAKIGQLRVSGITQKGYFDTIKAILNQAIKEDKYNPKKHPFLAFEPVKFEVIRKNLNKDEFEKINNIVKNPDEVASEKFFPERKSIPDDIFISAQKFKFQYYALGMRVSDMLLLKWSNIVENRIEYMMFKTKRTINFLITNELYRILYHFLPTSFQDESWDPRNSNKFNIEIHINNMKPILNRISIDETYKDEFIFKVVQNGDTGRVLYSKIQVATRKYNLELKQLKKYLKINSNITTHIPRHTFAINAIINKELDVYQLSKALNHSSVKVTENYLRGFNSTELDESIKNFYDGNFETHEVRSEKRKIKASFPALDVMNKEEKKKLLRALLNELD